MGKFFREYWFWMLLPLVLILIGVAVAIYLGESGPNEEFIYNL